MKRLLLTGALCASLLSSACVHWHHGKQRHRRSSTIEFLYPDEKSEAKAPSVPHLKIPLNVGIAFVPDHARNHRNQVISEDQKQQLLRSVAKQFASLPFIKNIETIPTTYLRPGGGFDNLRQLRTMLGIDVIALVSYDQVQHTDEDALALSYVTIIGAFLINGERNDTSTMLDTTVFHIPSEQLLFRAPGTSQVKARSSAVGHSKSLREDGLAGMQNANKQMIQNLHSELIRFQERIKQRPEQFKITRAEGYKGGGNLGFAGGLLACLLLLAAWRRNESVTQ